LGILLIKGLVELKIFIIGEVIGNRDEGMKNTSYSIYTELKKIGYDVSALSPKKFFYPSFWREIKKFNPEIVHYIAGPSIISFIILKFLKIYCRNVKTLMSVIHPKYLLSKRIISILSPDLMLIQTYDMEELCKDIKCDFTFLPNGVDTKKFQPVNHDLKKRLREKFNVAHDKFVVLHVGNIRKGRNLSVFKKINHEDVEVIIVSSGTISKDETHYQELNQYGFRIIDEYIPNIDEMYNLADCYVFPTFKRHNCIEMPLSVMEAMSCNIPVISTKFGALPRVFEEGDGLIFANNEDEIINGITKLKLRIEEIHVRDKILAYSWFEVVKELTGIYLHILDRNE